MADELNKKSPVPNPGSSSVSAPKPAPEPKANPNPVNAPKPAANNFSTPKANASPKPVPNPAPKPALNPVNNVKPQPKVDPVQQKIENAGFAPKNPEPKKSSGYNYDQLSKELDKGDYALVDAGLLPYEHGFETNGHEDLAVNARKNEEGKYEVYMYPETEDGPVSDYEPDKNDPTIVFDTFDELKEYIENGYKTKEQLEREKASKMFGVNLNKR